ncbi:hypothetical protein FJW08_24395 [Mesorhizobium sp. B3-2-1]|nr:hypothetical protein FJW08_24395 [Mesorhizobium sp. B3-2-1]
MARYPAFTSRSHVPVTRSDADDHASPILAGAFVLAAAAALALGSMVVQAGRRSMVRGRNHRTNQKIQG